MPHIYSRNVPAVSTTLTLVYTTYVHSRDRELVTPDEHPGRPVNSVEIHISYTVKQQGEESPKSAQCEPFQRAELVSPFLEQCFLLQEGGDGFKRVTCVKRKIVQGLVTTGHHIEGIQAQGKGNSGEVAGGAGAVLGVSVGPGPWAPGAVSAPPVRTRTGRP